MAHTKYDVVDSYPNRRFSEEFDRIESAFRNLGSASFRSKREEHAGLFDYDALVSDLYHTIARLPDEREINPRSLRKISKHFYNIFRLHELLSKLNSTDINNIESIFHYFDSQVRLLGLGSQQIAKTLDSGDVIYAGVTPIDTEISEVKELIQEFSQLPTVTDVIARVDALEGRIVSTLESAAQITAEQQKKLAELSNTAQKIDELGARLIENEEKYIKAAEVAENWIETEGKATTLSIREKSDLFKNKAHEHRLRNIWWWLAAASILAVMTVGSAAYLIKELNGDHQISVGAALIRFSLIAALSTTSFLAYRQYYVHRRLNETYRFKAIALSTMEELIKTYTDPSERASIISQAISIIFTEPHIKEDRAVQQRMFDEMLDVVKKKI